MLFLEAKHGDELPASIRQQTTLCFEITGPRGPIGTVGAIPTNRLFNEYFVWFCLSGRIGRVELALLKENLKDFVTRENVRLWMTTSYEDRLLRWAKMLGFEADGEYNNAQRWRL